MGNYVTRDELRAHIDYRQEYVEDNTQIDAAIGAAEAVVENYCGRVFYPDASPTVRIYEAAEVGVIDDVADTGTATVEWSSDRSTWSSYTGDFYWNNDGAGFGADGTAWPATGLVYLAGSPGGWLRITATHGWTTAPAPVVHSTKLVAAQLLARRNSPNGIEAYGDFGIVRASRYLDGHAELELRPYRRVDAFLGIA